MTEIVQRLVHVSNLPTKAMAAQIFQSPHSRRLYIRAARHFVCRLSKQGRASVAYYGRTHREFPAVLATIHAEVRIPERV